MTGPIVPRLYNPYPLAALLKRAGYAVPPSGGSRHITPRERKAGLDPTWPAKKEEEAV